VKTPAKHAKDASVFRCQPFFRILPSPHLPHEPLARVDEFARSVNLAVPLSVGVSDNRAGKEQGWSVAYGCVVGVRPCCASTSVSHDRTTSLTRGASSGRNVA
jgi:hypothetical protein